MPNLFHNANAQKTDTSECFYSEALQVLNCSDLSINFSNRLKKGWRVSAKDYKRTLTLPSYFKDAPRPVVQAVISWALLPHFNRAKNNKVVKSQKRSFEHIIKEYISNSDGYEKRCRSDLSKIENLSQGSFYDLRQIFNSVNNSFFSGRLESYLRWGKSDSRTSYHTIRTDKSGVDFHLITIAGVYDSPIVPEFVIKGIMYHEMLHIAIPAYLKNGRRVVHSREFKEAERNYPFYNEWIEWEHRNMHRLIRIKKQKRRKKSYLK
ncbi:hypothetical protein QA601_09945 [Chitinispirillales bacterium ANBcel5]|uniref:hypothetical protein n=1 Tax=Cellulosispirillum alkaliphilum TaxID=3039283 RepID=UPI002A523C3F|nr:hypothetical protein [Chitinispirillales bacterium ANBcel5]